VLCSIDLLTQVDHSAVVTPAASDAVLIVDGVFAFRPEINYELTDAGREALDDFAKEWARFRDSVDAILTKEER
jgi:hypothetical protein